jgi:hypothetical protein
MHSLSTITKLAHLRFKWPPGLASWIVLLGELLRSQHPWVYLDLSLSEKQGVLGAAAAAQRPVAALGLLWPDTLGPQVCRTSQHPKSMG